MQTKEDIQIEIKEVERKSYPTGKTYLFFMAIDNYDKNVGKLNNAVSDSKLILDCLIKNYYFDVENPPLILTNDQVTDDSIENAFKNYEKLLTDQDSLIFFFSGHGSYDVANKKGYWLTCKSKSGQFDSFLQNSKIIEYISTLKARHVFGIVDACFSGAIFKDKRIASIGSKDFVLPSRWILTAGRLSPVSDGSLGSQSPFAKSLLAQLEYNNSLNLWIGDLCDNVLKGVTYNTDKQLPRGEPLFGVGHYGGEFRIVRSAKLEMPVKEDIAILKEKLVVSLENDKWEALFSQLKESLPRGENRITLTQFITQYRDIKKDKFRNVERRGKVKLSINQLRMDVLTFIEELRVEDFRSN